LAGPISGNLVSLCLSKATVLSIAQLGGGVFTRR
jgi:hypothetical protein